jgi:hypothetical protein
MIHHPSPREFTLLIAVLVAGIMLALAFAIYNIVSKELVLSSSGRESQFALYAADSGIECALYWDYQENAFASTTDPSGTLACGENVTTYTRDYEVSTKTTTTRFDFLLEGDTTGPCTRVTVTRVDEPRTRTTILSEGFNTCVVTNPRRIQRSIQVQY